MHRHIVWESWNEIEKEYLEDESSESDDQEENDLEEDSEFSAYQKMAMSELEHIQAQPSPIVTPFGVYSDKSKLKPSDRWDCWIGNTNFGITEELALQIEEAEGVASLRVMDRYTFCIGVAKLFNIKQVANNIQEAICNIEEEKPENNLDDLNIDTFKNLFEGYKFWSVYIHENGNLDWCFSNEDNDEEYIRNVDKFNLLKSKNGGYIINN